MIVTLALEPLLYLFISSIATVILFIFGQDSLSHSLGILSITKQLMLSLVCICIMLLGFSLVIDILLHNHVFEYQRIPTFFYILISWLTGTAYIINYVPALKKLIFNLHHATKDGTSLYSVIQNDKQLFIRNLNFSKDYKYITDMANAFFDKKIEEYSDKYVEI